MRLLALTTFAGLCLGVPAVADTVLSGNNSVQGGLCVGLDCSASEFPLGGDWLTVKSLNPFIVIEGSSTQAGQSDRTWTIGANGATDAFEYFRIWDQSVLVFQIDADAPANALFMSSGGDLGLGTSLPQGSIHITDATLASIRREQTTGGGNAPGEWEIRATNGGFWLIDLTGDSFSTVFQIQQGAPHLALTLDD